MQDVDRKADNQERPYRDVVERRRWMATLAKTDRLLQGRTATVDIKPLAFRLDGRWTAEGVWKRVWKTRLSYVVAMSTVLAVVPVQRVG